MRIADVLNIGRENQRLVIVDGFAASLEPLRAAAAVAPFVPAHHAYPGIRADLPNDYWRAQADAIGEAVTQLGFSRSTFEVIDGSFSIVTTPRSMLSVAQRLPHCDAVEHGRIALVHYLAEDGGASGGTAFYRHRSTGFETVDVDRAPIYAAQLDAELRYGALLAAEYMAGDTRLFEEIARVAARPNRAVLYRSIALHSGVIPPEAPLSSDPARGRLTVTGFLQVR